LSTKIVEFWKIAECPKDHQESKSCRTIAKDHAMVKFPKPLTGLVETEARYAICFAPAPDAALRALDGDEIYVCPFAVDRDHRCTGLGRG
jgi:hypothetical protein